MTKGMSLNLLGVGLCLVFSADAMPNGNAGELNGQNAGQTPLAMVVDGNQGVPNGEQSAVQAALAKMPTAAERAQAELKAKIEKRKADLAQKAVQAVDTAWEAYKKALAEEIVKGVKLKKTNTSEEMSDRLKLQIRVDLCLDRLNKARGAFVPNSPDYDWLEGAIKSVEGANSMFQLDDELSKVVADLLVRVNTVFTEKWDRHMEQVRRGMPLHPMFPMMETAIRNIKIDDDKDKDAFCKFINELQDLVFGRMMTAGQLVDYVEANVKVSKDLVAQIKKAILESVK